MTLRALQSIASKHNRDERRATSRSGTMPRQRKGEARTAKSPTGLRGNLIPGSAAGENNSPSPRPITEDQAIQQVSAILLTLPVGDVATAAKSTKHAAKGWQQGKAMPRSVALINMAQTIPEIWDWIVHARGAQPNTAPALDELLEEALRQVKGRVR